MSDFEKRIFRISLSYTNFTNTHLFFHVSRVAIIFAIGVIIIPACVIKHTLFVMKTEVRSNCRSHSYSDPYFPMVSRWPIIHYRCVISPCLVSRKPEMSQNRGTRIWTLKHIKLKICNLLSYNLIQLYIFLQKKKKRYKKYGTYT